MFVLEKNGKNEEEKNHLEVMKAVFLLVQQKKCERTSGKDESYKPHRKYYLVKKN